MPTWNFKPADKIENTVLALIQQMRWMFSKLDSKNVKRLDTNETTIKSKDGTTYINGPVLEMRDATLTMRLKQGYDAATGKFVYQLYDATGAITIDLNSSGEATFKGNIETLKNAFIGNDLYLGSTATGAITKALRLRAATKDIVFRGYVDDTGSPANIGIGLLNSTDASTAVLQYMNGRVFLYGSMVLASDGSASNGNLVVGGKFGCNGKLEQGSYTVNAAAAENLTAVTALVNQLRTALINNGICV